MDIYALTDNALLKQIGQKLKEERVRCNISQKILAERCGLSPFSISQMENGHNTSLLSLVMVLRALNRLEVLEGLFEEEPISPVALSEYLKRNPRRQRAYSVGVPSTGTFVAEDFEWDKDK